ncbi:MAG TPA: response regulator [Polyangia bacterium]|jgi:signal transduction histidine kinase
MTSPGDPARAPADIPADILAVDDAPANLIALDALLARPGVNVVRAASGVEALARLQEREFAAVVLDAQMPILSGFEVARRIRRAEAGSATPIIFLTAFEVGADEIRSAYASGAVDFLVKPFDPEVLRSKVAVFVELYRHRREAAAAAALAARIERERAEAAGREAEHRRIDRLKDEFLATLAHELRTPLTSLVVAADSLARVPAPDPALARAHALIRGQLAHLCRLVDDSFEVARFTHGKIPLRPATLDLRDILHRAVELSQATIDARGVAINLVLPAEPVTTHADDVRLAQAIANLVTNAAKFSDWGGRVQVSLERVAPGAIIKVRDWGRGVPPPELERIFEPFVQADARDTWRGGLGIGLALVKRLIELHGGSVRAFSEGSRQGTELVVSLPLVAAPLALEEDDDDAVPAPDAAASRPRAPTRVLVVDDSSEVRSAVELFLQLAGHAVVATADCGRAALVEIARTNPDVVLLDIDLGDVDGYAVARQIRASRPDRRPRLVAMTGKVGADERDRALQAGFDDHVPKPIDGRTLVRLVSGD